jgi:hypothetical protein
MRPNPFKRPCTSWHPDPAAQPDCLNCRRALDPSDPYYRLWNSPTAPACTKVKKHKPTPAPRRVCLHLGKLIDRNSSCKGLCPHACEKGLGVNGICRPGLECQSCPEWEADG